MTTETLQPVAAKGGDFLIEDRTPGEVFTPASPSVEDTTTSTKSSTVTSTPPPTAAATQRFAPSPSSVLHFGPPCRPCTPAMLSPLAAVPAPLSASVTERAAPRTAATRRG